MPRAKIRQDYIVIQDMMTAKWGSVVESECGDFVCDCSDCMLENLVRCSHSLGVKDSYSWVILQAWLIIMFSWVRYDVSRKCVSVSWGDAAASFAEIYRNRLTSLEELAKEVFVKWYRELAWFSSYKVTHRSNHHIAHQSMCNYHLSVEETHLAVSWIGCGRVGGTNTEGVM